MIYWVDIYAPTVYGPLSYYSLVLTSIFALGGQRAAGLEPDPQPGEILCGITVHIKGGGAVRVVHPDGRSAAFKNQTNQASLACGAALKLQAVPDQRWQFAGWENVPALQASWPTIRAEGGTEVTAVFELAGLSYQELDQPISDRSGQLVTSLPVAPPVLRDLSASGPNAFNTDPPEINLWYGQNQNFGQDGTPQLYVNILGNVADPQQDVSSLVYSLNGGAQVPLHIGGDGSLSDLRRLVDVGDFNIDLNVNDLNDGPNDVTILATDYLNNTDQLTMTVNYDSSTVWPLPYYVDWNKTGSIQDVAQVVDGKWNLVPDGVRTDPAYLGYDRILDLGDMAWTDFQVKVPVTVHAIDPAGYTDISYTPALGIVLRWLGHTDNPFACGQPKCGWLFPGAASWYDFDPGGTTAGKFSFWVNHNQKTSDTSGLMLVIGQPYYWKARAESPAGTYGKFKMKIWKVSDPEPANWLIEKDGTVDSLQNGSLLLLAHHVDATFGNFSICPVSNSPDTAGPVISNVQIVPGLDNATITWTTDEPATSRVDFGTSNAYGTTATAPTDCVTNHELVLEGLSSNQLYHFQITSEDIEGNSTAVDDDTFSTQGGPDVQEIALPTGWNMISAYVQPGDPQLENLLAGILDQTVIIKNGHGEVFWPAYFVNQIGSWASADGYQIYMLQPKTLSISGTQIDPAATTINLDAGFNNVAYLRDTPMPVDQALTSIQTELVIVKDGDGNIFWPGDGLNINTIGDMQPGRGYQIYVNSTAALTYPANN